MKDLLRLIEHHQWREISQRYKPEELAKLFPFKEGMLLSYHILLNEQMDDDLREFAVQLIDKIRKLYPKDWSSDWKNDIFLGDAFYLVMRYKEQYEAYKHSFDKVFPKSPALLVSMAGCYTIPSSPITIEDAEKWVLEALQQEQTIEAAVLIRGIYKTKGNKNKFAYWDKIFHELEKQQIYMKHKWPDFIEEAAAKNRCSR